MKRKEPFKLLLILSVLFLFACDGGGGDNGNDNTSSGDNETSGGTGVADPSATPVMTTPYLSSSDIVSANFSPWSNAHTGVDFPASGGLIPFQAVFSGQITSVNLVELASTGHWQVEVVIEYNSLFSALYAFEPMTTSQADGQTQLANIFVSQGQSVNQGNVIGNLFVSGVGSHLHFGLFNSNEGGDGVCPEPYFSTEARSSILNLIHQSNPGGSICD